MFNLDEDQTRRVKEYKAKLADMLVNVVGDAIEVTPAGNALLRHRRSAGFAVNRRNNPEGQVPKLRAENKLIGPIDHELPVLTVTSGDGKLLAIVAGYACHATVLSDYFISADWPGAAQTEIERRHPGVTALYFLGCGGDQNPLPRRRLAFVKEYGRRIRRRRRRCAQVVAQADRPHAGDRLRRNRPAVRRRCRREPNWKRRPPRAKSRRRPGPSSCSANGIATANCPPTYPYPVQAWKLGDDLTWIFLGGEVVVDYSLRLKTELGPGKTWVASYYERRDGLHPLPPRPPRRRLRRRPRPLPLRAPRAVGTGSRRRDREESPRTGSDSLKRQEVSEASRILAFRNLPHV